MAAPVNYYPFRVIGIMAFIDKVDNRQRALCRKAPASTACNDENFGLIIVVAESGANTVPPIERSVIGHQLTVPYRITLQSRGQEEGFI